MRFTILVGGCALHVNFAGASRGYPHLPFFLTYPFNTAGAENFVRRECCTCGVIMVSHADEKLRRGTALVLLLQRGCIPE